MVGKWFLWMKQYIPRDEQGITVKIVVYKLLRVVVVPLLPGTVCLLLSHWATLSKVMREVYLWVLTSKNHLNTDE